MACCPAHDDHTPSLSITQDGDRVLVHCHAGCTQEMVIRSLTHLGLWERDEPIKESLPPFNIPEMKKKEVAWYDYTDEDGQLLYQVVRYDPKSFRQRRPDKHGNWINSMGNVRRVPYRLRKVLNAVLDGSPILIVEGEKDVHAAEYIGCIATCNAMGADLGSGTKWLPEFSDYFLGADVIVIPDADIPGRKHADWVISTLQGKAHSIRVANPPTFCKDLHDWVERGAIFADIEAVCDLVYSEEIVSRKNIFHHVGNPFTAIQPIDWLAKDYFETNSLALMFGEPGSGKSFLALSLACCVATGTPWYGRAVKQGAVFYICGEGHAGLVRRFGAWSKHTGVILDEAPLYKSDHQVSLFDKDSSKLLLEDITELKEATGVVPSLIVVDTVARNFGGGDENSTKDMSLFIEHVDRYVRIPFQCNVLLIHHSGHVQGRARGSSALKAALDAEYMVAKDESMVTLTPTKMKDSELPPQINFKFTRVELGTFGDEEVFSAVLETQGDHLSVKVGKRLDGRPIIVQDVLETVMRGWLNLEDAQADLECSKKEMVEVLGRCVNKELIKKNFMGAYELTIKGENLISTTGCGLLNALMNQNTMKGQFD